MSSFVEEFRAKLEELNHTYGFDADYADVIEEAQEQLSKFPALPQSTIMRYMDEWLDELKEVSTYPPKGIREAINDLDEMFEDYRSMMV